MAFLKHIKTVKQFLFEQDLGLDMGLTDPAMGGQETPAPSKKPIKFLFLDDELELNRKKYPDGSSSVEYPVYSTYKEDLEEWIDSNIQITDKNKLNSSTLKLRQDNLLKIVKGEKVNISDDDAEFIEKLKNAMITDMFGSREPELTIIFTEDGIPTTQEINITFIPIKK
jgi:hypothetical protein